MGHMGCKLYEPSAAMDDSYGKKLEKEYQSIPRLV